MKYIVTGGAGVIGSHIVEKPAQQKHEVVTFDNLFSGKMENIRQFPKKRCQFCGGNYNRSHMSESKRDQFLLNLMSTPSKKQALSLKSGEIGLTTTGSLILLVLASVL